MKDVLASMSTHFLTFLMSKFDPDHAISLWWSDCKTVRRVNQRPRKYRARATQIVEHLSPKKKLSPLKIGMSGLIFMLIANLDTDILESD